MMPTRQATVGQQRTVEVAFGNDRFSAIAAGGLLRRIGQQYTGYLSFKHWQWSMAAGHQQRRTAPEPQLWVN